MQVLRHDPEFDTQYIMRLASCDPRFYRENYRTMSQTTHFTRQTAFEPAWRGFLSRRDPAGTNLSVGALARSRATRSLLVAEISSWLCLRCCFIHGINTEMSLPIDFQ